MCRHLFFFNDTATTEIYTLSLHDALPIWLYEAATRSEPGGVDAETIISLTLDPVHRGSLERFPDEARDRKSTRLNSSHANISYAVFCLKKKSTCSLPGSSGA